jgi:16S rRNA (adenine1518-N6/adenine1519-N6)-dimethyltransferase
MSLLALSVQVYGQPKIAAVLPAEAFFPVPKVDSAIIRVDMHPQPLMPAPLLNNFFLLAKAGFSQKRKTLRNSLSAGLRLSLPLTAQLLEAAGIDPMRRAETLSIDEWQRLATEYATLKTEHATSN